MAASPLLAATASISFTARSSSHCGAQLSVQTIFLITNLVSMEHGVQQHSMLARTGSISFNCMNSKIWMSLDVLDQCAAIQPDLRSQDPAARSGNSAENRRGFNHAAGPHGTVVAAVASGQD